MSGHPFLERLSSFVSDTDGEREAFLARIAELDDQLELATGAAKLNAETIVSQQRAYNAQLSNLHDEIGGMKKAFADVAEQRDRFRAQVRVLQDALGTLTRAKESVDALGRDRFDIEKAERYDSD